MSLPTITLRSGQKMPLLGLGTWQLSGAEMIAVIREALDLGYRHFDTALLYDNHAALAAAIAGYDRQRLFITSKFLLNDLSAVPPDYVEQACHRALRQLGLDYLDLFLLHWPDRSKPINLLLQRGTRLIAQGKIGALGVSNFTTGHLGDLNPILPIAVNQVEYHPLLNQQALAQAGAARGIVTTAFSPLLRGALEHLASLQAIAAGHGKTVAQVCLRWLIEKGIPAIPKAARREHLHQNIDIFDFSLRPEEIAQIDRLDRQQRFCQPKWADFGYQGASSR